jgi:hypothetical protein
MVRSQKHVDLRSLRLWINRVASDYEHAHARQGDNRRHKENLESIRQAIEGASNGSAKDTLRGLIASGVIHYKKSNQKIPEGTLPETLMLDFAVDALWPIVIARKLPREWFGSLEELTSSQLASLVGSARAAKTFWVRGTKNSVKRRRILYSEIARTSFADGILNLLKDLNDPRGGGSYLATVALADGFDAPPNGSTPKDLLRWLAEAAVVGVIGSRADALIVHVWDWLIENAAADGPPLPSGKGVIGTSDLGAPAVPASGASPTTGIGTPTSSPFPATGVGPLTRLIGAKGATVAGAIGAVAAAGAVAIAGAGAARQARPITSPDPGVMTVSQAPGAVAPSGTSGTVSNIPTVVHPTTVNNNNAPPLTGGASGPSPTVTTSPPVIPPPNSGSPPTSDPPALSAQPYDMTGSWLMKFARNDGSIEHDTITLKRFDDSKCVSASPCYGGRWYNVDAKAYEAADFIVTAFRSTSGAIKISGTEVDYAQKGPQRYEGTAPNDTSPLEGTWSQDNQTATFTLTRQP